MRTDKNYWKDAYRESWDASSTKEKSIKKLIEDNTGLQVIEIGLGAGTTEYISGSASDNKLTKGDADLYIPEKDCYIEVTGPNIPLAFNQPLWLRPDKVQNTKNKIGEGKGKIHVVFHVLTEKGTNNLIIRVILLNDLFFQCQANNEFPIVNPIIRGRLEKYLELPPEHALILSPEEFFIKLKSI